MGVKHYGGLSPDIVKRLSDGVAKHESWQEMYDELRQTIANLPKSAEALRLAYRRATGEYKDLRRNHMTPKIELQTSEHPAAAVAPTSTGVTGMLKADGSIEEERVVEASEDDFRNPRSVLVLHNYDPAAWELVWSKHGLWQGIPKKGEEARILFSSRITVRPKQMPDIEDIVRILETVEPKWIPDPPKKPERTDFVVELTLADLHLNKLAWAGTTGNDYDLKIACERVRLVVTDVLERMNGKRYGKIIVPVGNDMFNSDNSEGTTHKGTPQDNDTRQPKVFETAIALFVGIIEKMREYTDDVYVVLVPGNHDKDASMYFAHTMKAYFRNCPDVTVDTSPRPRKYIVFGKCLCVLGHFDKETKTLPELIPHEGRRKWGQVDYVEVHGSHLHRESYRTYAGFELRRASSITGRDEYHTEEGYDNPVVHMTYVWNPDLGMDTIWYSKIPGTKAEW